MKIIIEPTTDFKELAKLNMPVQQLHHALYPTEFKHHDLTQIEKAFKSMLSGADVHAYLAKVGEQSVGYILCFVVTRQENAFQYEKRVLNIDQISVEANYRSKSVAQNLLDAAIALAKDKGITEIQLDHWEGNVAANKFFSKCGFAYSKHRMRKLI